MEFLTALNQVVEITIRPRATSSRTGRISAQAVILAKAFLSQYEAKDENPDVFFYRFYEAANTAVMLLSFYRDTEFLVQFDKR